MADNLTLAIASDHAGVELKTTLKSDFPNISWKDLGPESTDSVDYPDFADRLCKMILSGECERGVLICGSGIGMSIRANRYSGIRAALCLSEHMAELSRQHNNANVLVLASRITDEKTIHNIVAKFLSTEFEGGRHQRRVDKLDAPINQ